MKTLNNETEQQCSGYISTKNLGNTFRLAYLTTKYPNVSHTFIRRELQEIERRGHFILRLAIRRSDFEPVDPADQAEFAKTFHCLSNSLRTHLAAFTSTVVHQPIQFAKALIFALKMGRKSKRGVIKYFYYLVQACTLLQELRRNDIQHIHVHFGTNPATVAQLIHQLGGPGYSFTVHGPAEFDSPIGLDLQGKIKDALFVLAISDYCYGQLLRWSNQTDWKKIHIVHCTVGDDFFNARQPVNSESNIFTCVGRLTPQKGHFILIEAFKKLLKKGYSAHLVLVGNGELRQQIELQIDEAGLQEYIYITGFCSEADVRKFIQDCRAMVLPSIAEGLPMSIMESFAVGRPVISTYVAGIPELVLPGLNGWLVPCGNVDELVKVLAEALDASKEQLESMASCGHEITSRKHRTIIEGDKLEKIFTHYLSQPQNQVE